MTEKVNKKYGKIICIFIIILLSISYFLYILCCNQLIFQSKEYTSRKPGWLKKESVPVKWPSPLILLWNKFYGENILKYWSIEKITDQCPYKCHYTDDRALEKNATVLFFHIRDKVDPMPKQRTPEQLYTFFVIESPPHTWNEGRYFPRNFFNITMTYRSDSDVIVPYVFESYNKEDVKNGVISLDEIWTEEEIDRKIAKKEKLTLQFVSNCNTNSKREKYIEKLKKFTEITQMGGCVGKNNCGRECEEKLIEFWNPNCKLCTSLQPFCDLCKLAHTNKKQLRINNIYAFWDGGGKCLHGYAENVLLN
uniref:Fucosyltransferase n=1 Tax=Meloidogyne hapla TaxID=6305 RepID=A0A1I8BUR7_MELHA